MKRNLVIGFAVGATLILAVTVWPTRYRYETKVRCTFNYRGPYENSDWGGDASKRYERSVTSTLKDEFYRVDRITGEVFVPGQEGWKLIGLAYDKPEEFLENAGNEFDEVKNEWKKRIEKEDWTPQKKKENLDELNKMLDEGKKKMSGEEFLKYWGKAETGCKKIYLKYQYSSSNDPTGYWITEEEKKADSPAKPSPTATKKPE